MQLLSIAGMMFGSASAQALKDYIGLKLKNDKSFVTFGPDAGIKLFRSNGNLKIVAPNVEFITGSMSANGKNIPIASAGGNNAALLARIQKLEKAGVNVAKPAPVPCDAEFGLDEVRAWNTGIRHHDQDLTKAFSDFDTDASVLVDNDIQTGLSIVSNYFWYIGVKFSTPCKSAEFNFMLTSNLHHLRTAYSMDGSKWTCASNYRDAGNNKRVFTGCKGGKAASYHGRHQTISFTKNAKYYAFGFRDAGTVSDLTMKCNGALVAPAVQQYRNAAGKCTGCPAGLVCNGNVACSKNQYAAPAGACLSCPAGKLCDGRYARPCGPSVGIDNIMAWNTGQRNHDVDLSRSFKQFTTDANMLRPGRPGGLSVVSNYFWYFGVKLSQPCDYAQFNFKLTSNLHHLRTAYSQDGNSWTCASDYTDSGNNNRKFSGCKGGSAAKYHGRHQTIRFTNTAKYYAFGFRDAGTVSELKGSCQDELLGSPVPRSVKNGKCSRCPRGNACADGVATPCGNKWADENRCKPCPEGYLCKNGVGDPCERTFGIEAARAWYSEKRTHDLDLTASWSEFNTDASVLLDGSTSTYINVVSNYFWWFAVKTGRPCKQSVFTFTMTSNLHHLRTAYSMDGSNWVCKSEYRDTGNNLRTINGICKGGNAASYHSNTGKSIFFNARAQYFAFGFRDAGQVRKLDMTCEGKSVPFRTQAQYIKDGTCMKCPKGMSCASGKPVKLKISKVMAWNTGQRTHDYDLSKSFSQFTTNAASLIDSNTGGTGINVVSNYFWYFGVQLSAECFKAKFTFQMTSNLHHLRTAYSQDGNSWTCASDYQDTGNNRRTFNTCKGGRSASYHSNKGKMLYFSAAAKYYAFGFRDAGKVTNLQMWCNDQLVPTK